MRLAQLARKLSVKPSDIIEFLAAQSIAMENSANAKVNEDNTRLAITHFAPHLLQAQVEELVQEEEAVLAVELETIVEEVMEEEVAVPDVEETINPSFDSEETESLPEIIRAPKIELSGLKVLGKIELPEKKKKEEATTEGQGQAVEEVGTENTDEFPVRKPKREKERKPERRVTRNVLEEARERERKAAEEKRKTERERKKELRTQNYLKKVQTGAPVKKAKAEVTVVQKPVIQKKEPTSLWGKFVKWLTTY
jgi:hypothetical protein